jgi:hypothetical protein
VDIMLIIFCCLVRLLRLAPSTTPTFAVLPFEFILKPNFIPWVVIEVGAAPGKDVVNAGAIVIVVNSRYIHATA